MSSTYSPAATPPPEKVVARTRIPRKPKSKAVADPAPVQPMAQEQMDVSADEAGAPTNGQTPFLAVLAPDVSQEVWTNYEDITDNDSLVPLAAAPTTLKGGLHEPVIENIDGDELGNSRSCVAQPLLPGLKKVLIAQKHAGDALLLHHHGTTHASQPGKCNIH